MPYFNRKPTRIPGYDYSMQNYYFITICTHEKMCIFGSASQLNELGQIVAEELRALPNHYQYIRLDNCIVMPNHIHMIIAVEGENNISINYVVGLFKSGVSKRIHTLQPSLKVWQRSFHDHIIRNQKEYETIWQYVTYNRQKWQDDCYYCE